MEGFYPDEFSKIALALTSAQLAKRLFVQELGKGEDLTFNFIGWRDGHVIVVAQLTKQYMELPPIERLQRCATMLRILRGFWNVDSISMIAEGYCSQDIEKTKGLDLQKVFEENEDCVEECITITHAEGRSDVEPDVNVVSTTYKYQADRRVVFSPMILYPNGAVRTLRDKSYPALLYKTVNESYVAMESTEEEAADSINELGFHLQVFEFPE